MSDIVDLANDLVEETITRSIQNMNRSPMKIGNRFCDDCGDQIPDTRRLAVMGCTRCLDCQSIYEIRQR